MAEREGDPPIDAFLDSLSASNRRTLSEAGFDMARLRELGATEAGARQVRHIVTEFGAAPGRRAAVRRLAGPAPSEIPDPPSRAVGFWLLYLLTAAVVLLVLFASTVLVGELLGVVVAVLGFAGLFFAWAAVPSVPWTGVAFLVTVPAMIVLLATTLLYAPDWYLSVKGRDAVATLEPPQYRWEHGARVATCRVRLPDGSVHGIRADAGCAGAAGTTRAVVY
ncbi:ABC transporter permease, partial [Actinacidiphila rubida]